MNILRNVPVVTRSLALALLVGTLNSQAALMDSATPASVPLPPNGEGEPANVNPIINGSGTSGTWVSTPADAAWVGIGSYTIAGPGTGNVATGTTTYTFGSGGLPVSTYFKFQDVDGGSGPGETIKLTAYDSGNNLITTPWLDTTVGVWGYGAGVLAAMPFYSWTSSTGTYLFDGAGETWPDNPNVNFALTNNMTIDTLVIEKATTNNGFSFGAPTSIPLPAAGWLFITGLLGLIGLGRTRRNQ